MPSLSLPVSGIQVGLREPTGRDELIALDRSATPPQTILKLGQALVHRVSGEAMTWDSLPAVDLSAVSLLLRSSWLGERIHTETICPVPGCGEPIDVAFVISDYLDHHRPRRFRGLEPRADGWFELSGETGVSFRIPTVADLLAASGEQRDVAWLSERCVRPSNPDPSVVRRVERALSAIAPRLDDHVGGRCPACGRPVDLFFEPISFVLEELRDVCAGLYADVHELAFAYSWSETSIMALDRRRRHSYVAMVRGELALA